jgi:hypothetical protein
MKISTTKMNQEISVHYLETLKHQLSNLPIEITASEFFLMKKKLSELKETTCTDLPKMMGNLFEISKVEFKHSKKSKETINWKNWVSQLINAILVMGFFFISYHLSIKLLF